MNWSKFLYLFQQLIMYKKIIEFNLNLLVINHYLFLEKKRKKIKIGFKVWLDQVCTAELGVA